MPVRFTLEKRTNKYGECPIRLSWSFGGQRYQTTIGFSVMKTYWDEKKCLVKPEFHNRKRQTANDINFYIKRIDQVVTGIEQHLAGNEKALTKTKMKNAYIRTIQSESLIIPILRNIAHYFRNNETN